MRIESITTARPLQPNDIIITRQSTLFSLLDYCWGASPPPDPSLPGLPALVHPEELLGVPQVVHPLLPGLGQPHPHSGLLHT